MFDKMFTNTLSPETLDFVKKIKVLDLPTDSYLSGGTAIALQIGHRKSIDKFSLFYYKHNLIGKNSDFYDIKLASLKDLAATKLDTVISRGTKRDLIDIYFLAQRFGLPKIFEFYNEKFSNFEEREIMIKKALIYFEDAEKDEAPHMLVPFEWKELKEFFRKEIKP